jgi:hypothetical protein
MYTIDTGKFIQNGGGVQVWLYKLTSAHCKSNLQFGLNKPFSTLVLNFNFSFSISSGCGRTEYLMPHLQPSPDVGGNYNRQIIK